MRTRYSRTTSDSNERTNAPLVRKTSEETCSVASKTSYKFEHVIREPYFSVKRNSVCLCVFFCDFFPWKHEVVWSCNCSVKEYNQENVGVNFRFSGGRPFRGLNFVLRIVVEFVASGLCRRPVPEKAESQLSRTRKKVTYGQFGLYRDL